MKFLHTSDWHLGRQFHNVSLLEDQRYVLKQLIDYLKNNAVDAVIVAGDVYDRSVPPTVAIELLDEVVSSICTDLNIPMIMIPGNHDGARRLGFAAKQMKGAGLHIISDFEQMMTPVVLKSELAGDVAFYGMPYNDPEQVRHHYQNSVTTHDEAHQFLCECIKAQRDTSQRHVLISHCFVDGAMESDSERPLSIGGSDRVNHEHFADFDYVALGHLHQPQKKGEEHIRYSGSLMKYSFSEQHQKKGMTLVELNDAGFVAAEHIPLSAPHDMRIIEGELDQLLEQGKTDPSAHDYLLVRLHDKHAILDPMEKLRKVYPNVLHLEKPGMLIGVDQEMGRARLARGELDMFRDFFLEAKQEPLSEQQESAMAEVIQSLKQAEQH
ncbi:exonuclease SbcCD subunit D [Vibrio fluvialis]|uniref:exonuclease SbcCD subunit D n=1 Tax=Vibrio fluvialis TaxID=676 RepID=UPI000645CD7D|nr:exonuclease SbcCD subunit D [Vibrio fluvialis]EKO3429508.1 exonuclease SbcCD subunit D [Vibrio fluvialis]EKO5123212.1 exonuclease SbcCD subunit D [Vibrio fluvialis]ELI5738104.1 exonuclease SbcCD subunit D [Vibrio fluvialis]ELL0572491.1 exonuclease SbcCD subunit D [Vibrio fluvialis]ELL7085538.1 exonuclease SbcCD subunit D [Vibrio fluvialis]